MFGYMDHNWHIYRDDDWEVPLHCHGGGITKEDTATYRNLVRFGWLPALYHIRNLGLHLVNCAAL